MNNMTGSKLIRLSDTTGPIQKGNIFWIEDGSKAISHPYLIISKIMDNRYGKINCLCLDGGPYYCGMIPIRTKSSSLTSNISWINPFTIYPWTTRKFQTRNFIGTIGDNNEVWSLIDQALKTTFFDASIEDYELRLNYYIRNNFSDILPAQEDEEDESTEDQNQNGENGGNCIKTYSGMSNKTTSTVDTVGMKETKKAVRINPLDPSVQELMKRPLYLQGVKPAKMTLEQVIQFAMLFRESPETAQIRAHLQSVKGCKQKWTHLQKIYDISYEMYLK